MVHFTLFGIPVYIRPSFWVVLAIFGGALSISSVEDLIYPALFVIAGFVAILSHEMGHALVGRKLDGGQLIAQYIRSPRKVFMTGFITAILIGLLSFQLFHGYFIPIFMALFAYSNYREYKNAPF